MAGNPYYEGAVSDHFDGTRFFNPSQPSTDRSLSELLRWQLLSTKTRWPRAVEITAARPRERVADLAITMVGHASVLIQVGGINLLTDPVWSDRASPVGWAGPKRVTPPGIAFDDLPPIDRVLLTHNHYDHLDLATLRRLQNGHDAPIVTCLGNDVIIAAGLAAARIEALDWHQSITVAEGTSVTAVPANHWSARGRGDRRMALWCGFLIRTPVRAVYVVGDTGFGDGAIFRELRDRYGAPDVALIPIGAYEPRWFMADQHVSPEEAVRILIDTGARQALGVHWGTFRLTDEGRDEPPAALTAALVEGGIERSRFLPLEPGQTWLVG